MQGAGTRQTRRRRSAVTERLAPDDILREFFLGFIRIHVLYHASLEPVCGVDLMTELRRHGYELTPGTLYPLLHRLERGGYLLREDRQVNGRWRKYYTLTGQGEPILAEARRRLPELVGEVLATQPGDPDGSPSEGRPAEPG